MLSAGRSQPRCPTMPENTPAGPPSSPASRLSSKPLLLRPPMTTSSSAPQARDTPCGPQNLLSENLRVLCASVTDPVTMLASDVQSIPRRTAQGDALSRMASDGCAGCSAS